MNKDDVIRMAREAGMPPAEIITDKPVVYPVPEALERFAALVAATEREACARVCEDINAKYAWPADIAERVASQWCADAIRARGNT